MAALARLARSFIFSSRKGAPLPSVRSFSRAWSRVQLKGGGGITFSFLPFLPPPPLPFLPFLPLGSGGGAGTVW